MIRSFPIDLYTVYMTGRRKVHLDYAELHRTGRRVEVQRNPKMGDELRNRAIDVSSDVEDLFETLDYEGTNDVDELNEYVKSIENTKKEYRRVFAQIQAVEGNDFDTKYPLYEETLKELNDKLKGATAKLRECKKKNKNDADNMRDTGRNATAKLQSKSEHKYFVDQAEWELDDCDWEKFHDVEDIKSQITLFERRLVEFFKICSELKGCYGDEFDDLGVDANNAQLVLMLREKVISGKTRILVLRTDKIDLEQQQREAEEQQRAADEEARALAENARIQEIEQSEKEKIKNLLVCAEGLKFEIQTRYDTLKSKCEINFSELSDYEILDVKKREESFHVELRELMDKISSFEKYVLPCGDKVADLRKTVIGLRDGGTKLLDEFLKNLRKVITDRDISEKKLKNTAGLKIELGKFKGYNSDMDIYTFRTEFSKLVEPEVRKGLWADYLKKNCLTGPAQNLVSKMEDIGSIWEKLIEVYGDTQVLLQNKIGSLKKFSDLVKQKDDEKIAHSLTNLLNVMADLENLASKYDLEGDLYHGGGLQSVLDLLGTTRERKFIKSVSKLKLKNKAKWSKLVLFLTEELSEREAYVLNEKSKKSLERDKRDSKDPDEKGSKGNQKKRDSEGFNSDPKKPPVKPVPPVPPVKPVCLICGKSEGHVVKVGPDGKSRIEYISCKMFIELAASARDKLLFKKRFCSKCLKPGAKWNSDHNCNKKYACNHPYVNKNGDNAICEKHVLVCGFHCEEKSNQDLLEVYKQDLIKIDEKFKDFVKNVVICFSESYSTDEPESNDEEESVFAFQDVDAGDGVTGNAFYDNGCGNMCCTKEFADKLEAVGRARCVCPGPVLLNGAAGQVSSHEHGIYEVTMRLANGKDAVMTGLCCDSLTIPFPRYPLKQVEKDFHEQISKTDPKILSDLPSLPDYVGGKVDIMIGKQYLKYSPREVAQLDSGLTLSRSRFQSPDGKVGVILGPHPEFTKVDRVAHFSQKSYYTSTVEKYLNYSRLIDEVPLLGYKDPAPHDDEGADFSFDVFATSRGPKCLKHFEIMQDTGTIISYRCMKCRNCVACKNASQIEDISLQAEAEQDLINNSVDVDIYDKHEAFAELPFIADPKVRLDPTNYPMSRKVYNSVTKALSKDPKGREDTIKAEGKLHSLGYVEWLDNLSEEDREMILNAIVKYFIPWRVVWSSSISTPVRPVFDASQRGPNGCSLNDILAKGSNNMNNLVQILLRWITHIWAYHTDIRTMYNRVKLLKPFWCYQLYLWEKDLDPSKEPLIKVIMTLIYGVRSSGNQAERAIRLTAEKNAEEFPKAYDIIHHDTYVDDVVSGAESEELGTQATESRE